MSGLSGAVENVGPVSRLHAVESFDPADFPVPAGREEEWRFTPLRRLRKLHADAEFSAVVKPEVSAESEITVVLAQHSDPRIGTALVPSDRVSARAFAAFSNATVITVPAGYVASQPVVVSVRGADTTVMAAG